MASLISSTELTFFTGALKSHFDTFTREGTRLITVYKEPLKTVTNSSQNLYGYGDVSNPVNITYTDVTGIFPAMISHKLDQKKAELEEIKVSVNKGEVRIKVEAPARDFIEDGRLNQRVDFDGKSYNIISSDGIQNYMGLIFYVYTLQNTK